MTDRRSRRAPRKPHGPFARIEDAVEAIRAGRMVIVVDDEDRENEGDLTIAAEKVTPEAINFMARYGRGLICLSMTPERLDELEIPLMVSQNTSRFETAFCVPIEAKGRTTTGISAADRAATVLAAIDPATQAGRSRAARPHVSAAVAHRRRDGARRPDRSGGRSRAHRRSVSGRRHLRNHERGRHDGARAAADEVREEARPADDHDRRSDQVPHAHRVAGQARRVGEAADRVRRVSRSTCSRISVDKQDARRARPRRHRRRQGRARARALVVPDRRRAALGPLRLRRAARRGDASASPTKGAACCCT